MPTSYEEMLRSGMIKKGNDPYLKVHKLPTGIAPLDTMLAGGVAIGRCTELYGPESTGKTLIGQYIAKAVQESEHPAVLYVDLERSYDEAWWQQSGVDTEKLMVSDPTTAEQAIDIMRATSHDPDLGLIILDSIAAMTPQPEMDPDKSSEDNKQPGLQAKVCTLMYRQMVPLLDNRIIFLSLNQMRENIGVHDELKALPGGRAQRHYNHVILRTARESWITDNSSGQRLGFDMEITNKKNKLASTPDGYSITLPFMFNSQIDFTTTYIEEGLRIGLIVKHGPYYNYLGTRVLGKANLRQFFADNPEELENLKNTIAA